MGLLWMLAHHPDAGDPDHLEWIKRQLDAVLGLGPLVVVLVLGVVILSIPTVILVAYVVQRRRGGYRMR